MLKGLAWILVLPSLTQSLPAQWRSVGPFGGATAIVAVDRQQPGVVLTATPNALLFRSSDSGDSWRPLPFPAQLHSTLHALVTDPRQAGVYWAGVASESAWLSGLWRTQDAGAHWELVPALRGQSVWSIDIFPGDSQVIAAGVQSGIMLSRDGGTTWGRISPEENRELQPVVSLAFDPSNSQVIYAGTPHLPWKTEDGGAAWHSVHAGMLDDSDVFSIQVDPHSPKQVFASACSGMYCSRDGAASWRKMQGAREASYRTYLIRQHPQNEKILFAGTTHGLVRSQDGGVTWRKLTPHATRWVAFDAVRPGRIYIATDEAGILRSDDYGDTVQEINGGFCNRPMPAWNAAGEHFLLSSAGTSLLRFNLSEERWEPFAAGPMFRGQQITRLDAAPGSSGALFAAGYNLISRSMDGGRHWAAPVASPGKSHITALLAESSSKLLAGTDTGLFSSADAGVSWARVELPGSLGPIRVLARLRNGANAAVTRTGIFLSADGKNWTASASLPGGAEPYGAIAGEAGRLVAATSAGLVESSDGGKSWMKAGSGMPEGTVSALLFHPIDSRIVVAGQYGRLYGSWDGGLNWRKISPEDWTAASIAGLAISPTAPSRLLVVTPSQGVLILDLDAARISAANTNQHVVVKAER